MKKRVQRRCLVIDASVAQAAGTLGARNLRGVHCRDFLVTVRGVCHHMAWSEALRVEWEKHESPFAIQWRVTMTNLKKLRPVAGELSQELRREINGHSKDKNVVAIMVKDAHLVEAALATHKRVASLDDQVRAHFSRLAGSFHVLRAVVWINPSIEEEEAIEWLDEGAPDERFRRLGR